MAELIDPAVAERYDFSDLVAAEVKARLLLRRTGSPQTSGGEDRYEAAARALCSFYSLLLDDTVFWQVAASVTARPQPDISELFETLDGFAVQEYDLLRQVPGMDEATAAEVTDDLARSLRRYKRDLPAAEDIRVSIEVIAGWVCNAQDDVRDPERRRGAIRLLVRAAKIAGAVAVAAVDIAISEVGSVIGGLTTVVVESAELISDRT